MNYIIMGIAGFLSGLIGAMGMGGGAVLLIYLTAIVNIEQINAQGINLVFFIPCAIIAIIFHEKNGYIKWKAIPPLAVAGVIGVFIGTYISSSLSSVWLRRGFGTLLIIMAIKELFPNILSLKKPKEK